MWYVYKILLAAVVFIGISLVTVISLQVSRIQKIPTHLPWVGLKNRWVLPKLRACLSEFTSNKSMATEGYEKYSKNGKAFILPGLHWSTVILPPSDAKWIASQPEAVLAADKTLDDLVGFDYLSHGPSSESVHDFSVIRKDLTRRMGDTLPLVLDELVVSCEGVFGTDTENWKTVKLVQTLSDAAFQAINCMFVGLPLARDKGFLKAIQHWTVVFGVTSTIMRYLVPYPLRPWIMPTLALPAYLFQWRAARYILPEIHRRLKIVQTATDEKSGSANQPNDMMQWIIQHNATKPDPAELAPMNIAGRLILFNIFATVTTPNIAGLVLVDILSSAHANSTLDTLRAEAERIMPKAATDLRALREMTCLDSAIRETMRVNPMGAQTMMREVMVPGGVTAPSDTFIPQGCHVAAFSRYMQRDTTIHGAGADEYDPLRFCRDEVSDDKQKAAVQISDHFLSFGLGKHACPGRFFAVNTMKLLLGYLLVNYEIKPFEKPPKMLEIGDAYLPSDKIMIEVKRRKAQLGTEDAG